MPSKNPEINQVLRQRLSKDTFVGIQHMELKCSLWHYSYYL